jgi:hypothetical protein
MRILTAGFDHTRTEHLGQRLTDAGHSVMSASGASSCRTLASSVTPDVLLVPSGEVGEQAAGWAAELLTETVVLELKVDADPVAAVDALKGPRTAQDHPTEQIEEADLVAALTRSGAPLTEQRSEASVLAAITHAETPMTELLSEAAILATIPGIAHDLHTLPNPPVPMAPKSVLDTPRRSAILRSTSVGPSLTDKLNDIRFGDYHAILELQPGASTYVVRQQYDSLKQLYTPSGWHEPVGPTEIDSLSEIGQGLDDAFSILGHPTYQSRYESALDAGTSPRA